MQALDRKLLRDVRRLAPQLAAVVAVTACGVGIVVMAWSMLASLEATRRAEYARARFPDLFVHLREAPDVVGRRLAALPGIDRVETRIVEDVTIRFPGSRAAPATGRLVSLPAEDGLCRLHLTRGRMPEGSGREILVGAGFAEKRGLAPGDRVEAVLSGSLASFTIVGIATSAEYVYAVPPGVPFPDDRAFGVFWLDRRTLAAAFDMEDAFNDVVATLVPGTDPRDAARALDAELDRYGGLSAHGRAEQSSHRYLTNELRELRNMGLVAPLLFLAVTAILVHLVLSRLVGLQGEQIATLSAFGYPPVRLALHFAKLAALVVGVGALAGVVLGWWLGTGMARMYAGFFRFPRLAFELHLPVVVLGVSVAALAAFLGVARALREVLRIAPAAAMQPPAPPRHARALLERLVPAASLPIGARMILRHLGRRPLATALSIAGLSTGVAVMVLGTFVGDAVEALGDFQFSVVQRYDRAVAFDEPVAGAAIRDLRRLPGVTAVEPYRSVPVILRHAHHERRETILGLAPSATLSRAVDRNGRVHAPRADGLLVSLKLAELLGTHPGDWIEVEVLEGHRPRLRLPLADTVDDMIGTGAWFDLTALNRLMGEEDAVSGAFLATSGAAPDAAVDLEGELAEIPQIAGSSSRQAQLASFRDTIARMLLRMRVVNALFAVTIACGVVATTARQSLAERSRDLASLRVLGFSRRETGAILLGEQAVLVLAAIPPGLLLGVGFVFLATQGYDTELFRVPVVIRRRTLALAALTVLAAAIATAAWIRRSLDDLDLVAVLKARD